MEAWLLYSMNVALNFHQRYPEKDGAMLYITSDIACVKYRLTNGLETDNDWIFCWYAPITSFRQVFTITHLCLPELPWVSRFLPCWKWCYTIEDGGYEHKKILSVLRTLIDDAFDRVRPCLRKNIAYSQMKISMLLSELWNMRTSQDREKDVVFDTDKATALEWNSGPYIQYALFELKKFLRQTGRRIIDILFRDGIIVWSWTPSYYWEWESQTIIDAHSRVKFMIALQAYAIASMFNAFYSHGKITTEEDWISRRGRLSLVRHHMNTFVRSSHLWVPLPQHM